MIKHNLMVLSGVEPPKSIEQVYRLTNDYVGVDMNADFFRKQKALSAFSALVRVPFETVGWLDFFSSKIVP